MRILLLTQWFDPEPTFKGLLFAKALSRRGHDVRVLTGYPNYPGGTLYEGHRIRGMTREVIEGVHVLRVPLYPSHDESVLHRIANYASFAASATVASLFVRRPDVVYVYHPPATIALPALALKAFRGVPVVYDVQDLWPDTLAATGMVRNRAALTAAGLWMRATYRAAAKVVVLSGGFRDVIASRGVPGGKIAVIHNWADETRIQLSEPSPARAQELGFTDAFTVVFAGTMGPAQALVTVLDAAEMLRPHPHIRFLLVGGGVEVKALTAEAGRRGLENVTFLPARPIEEIGEVLALADALLVHLKDDPLFEVTVPSKTQAYLMAGRPILMGVRGEAATLVREAQAGIVFEPERADQLTESILRMAGMSLDERLSIGAKGSAYYREKLALDVGVSKFVTVFEEARLSKPRLCLAKRLVDILLGSAAAAVVCVPAAIVAVAIRRNLGSPVLFRQTRPGRHGQPFEVIKFRSMTDARDVAGDLLPDGKRITRFGAWLRSSSLDELPELWNVLRGDMSLVGPRPLLMRYTEFFTDEERLRLSVRPGLTGWAQVNGRNTASWAERLGMDVWYVRNRSLLVDVRILLMTVRRVWKRSGVVVDPESVMADLDVERRDRSAVK